MAAVDFIPRIVEQHSEDAASLWLIRDYSVRASSFRLGDLVRLDERVEANLDGLRIAKMRGWTDSLDELDQGGAGEFFATAVLAVESGDPGLFDPIIEQAYTRATKSASDGYQRADDPWRGLVSALAWVGREHATGAIARLLEIPRPRTRWLGVAACGARRTVGQPSLEAALGDSEPLVRARAARTVGELGRTDFRAALNALLVDADENCRFWAAWSAARLGTIEGLRALEDHARAPGIWCDRALDLLLRRMSIEQSNTFLRLLACDPERRRTVIKAAGVTGDARYVPWLIDQTNEAAVARAAGDALATITGAEIADLNRDQPPDFQLEPNDDPDDENVALDADEGLAWPDPEKLGQWWEANKGRFTVGTAYFLGTPKQSTDWIGILSEARQCRRRAATLELALRRPHQAMFEVRARGDIQQRLLKAASEAAARSR